MLTQPGSNTVKLQFARSYFNFLKSLFGLLKNCALYTFDFSIRSVKHNLLTLLLFLKYDFLHQFNICIDIIVYDQPGKPYRFTVIYYLLSLNYNSRYKLISQTSATIGLETTVGLYKSANWSEREVWDLFGIFILYHPDLRRILTDYGFSGFPLRKDFPLSGYKEIVYSDVVKNTEYRKIELTQELRTYKYERSWKVK